MKSIVIDRTYFYKNIRYKWRSSAGKEIYVDELEDNHLRNIHRLINDTKRYFPAKYMGYSRSKWRDVLSIEISKRVGCISRIKYKL